MAPSRDDLLYRDTIDPPIFKIMVDSFEEAWASVEGDFVGAPQQEIEAVRTALAQSIVQVVREGYNDPAVMKRAALGAFGSFAKPSDTHKMN